MTHKNTRSSPVKLMWLPAIDQSIFPMPIKTLTKGVQAALPVIKDGGSILIGMGYNADGAMQLIQEKRAIADPYVGYIKSIYLFEK